MPAAHGPRPANPWALAGQAGGVLAWLRAAWRHDGPAILVWRMTTKLLSPLAVVEVARLYEKDLDGPIVDVRAPADVVVAEASASDIVQVGCLLLDEPDVSARRVAAILETLVALLQRGFRCFVAKIGEEVVAYDWLAFPRAGPFSVPGGYLRLVDGEAFCQGAYTAPAWRGRGLHIAILSRMLLWLREAGVRKVYTAVSRDNRSSWKAHERLEWVVRSTIVCVTWRGRNRSWVFGTRGISSRLIARGRSAVLESAPPAP